MIEKQNEIAEWIMKIVKLQNFAVEIRYPNEVKYLTNEKVLEAIKTSKLVRKVIT
jgi:hypothetical protein